MIAVLRHSLSTSDRAVARFSRCAASEELA
jgi:hypothetical protein